MAKRPGHRSCAARAARGVAGRLAPTTAGGAPTTAPERPVSLRRAPLARCPAQPFGPPRPQRIYLRQTRVAAAGGVVRQPESLLPGAPDRHTWRAIRADPGTD